MDESLKCENYGDMKYYRGFRTGFTVYKVVVPVHVMTPKETFEWEWVDMMADDGAVGSRDLDILKIWLRRTDVRFYSKPSATEVSYLALCRGYEMADLKDFLDDMGVAYDIYEYRAEGDVKWTEDLYEKGEGNVG